MPVWGRAPRPSKPSNARLGFLSTAQSYRSQFQRVRICLLYRGQMREMSTCDRTANRHCHKDLRFYERSQYPSAAKAGLVLRHLRRG